MNARARRHGRALVSAHEYAARHGRAGATVTELLEDAVAMGADYVELDVRRTVDGVFVVLHARHVVIDGEPRPVSTLTMAELRAAGVDVVTYDAALRVLAGRARAHLDLKFGSPDPLYGGPADQVWEVQASGRAIEILGADAVVVTSGHDHGVAAVRHWAELAYPGLLVGISLGGSRKGRPLMTQLRGRFGELFPGQRVRASNANLVVANKWLALLNVARWTARRGLPLLVWTVDEPWMLRRWLSDPRCWMLTTNRVEDAVRLRDSVER